LKFGDLFPTFKRDDTLERQDTTVDWDTQMHNFWETLKGTGFTPRLIDRVWVANRCMQLCCQEIASMPLRFFGTTTPAWVSNPDPIWYPNGIGDAVFAATWSMYGWGDAFLYVTSTYANGLPSGWTVLNPEPISVEQNADGTRKYRSGNTLLDSSRVVQITRDPRGGLRGTSALRSYAPHLWASLAAGELGQVMVGEGSVPHAVLKLQKGHKIDKAQAAGIQNQWALASAVRRGLPAVLPPEIEFEQLAFSPKDLLLLDAQQFEARVIASAFGVPPFLLGMPLEGSLTYQSPDMLIEQWWRTELRPAQFRISQALSAQMLPRGSWVEFDARDILAPPLPELVKAWSQLLADGAVTVDEYRAAVLRLPPLEQGDELGAVDELRTPAVANSNTNVQPLRPAMAQDAVVEGVLSP